MVMTSNSDSLRRLKKKLMSRYAMINMEEEGVVLGMAMTSNRKQDTLMVSQQPYVASILERYEKQDCNGVSAHQGRGKTI